MTMTFGSLFTGVGGFDLGFERAGMKCAWQCEIDKYCNEILERHWAEVRRYNDVRKITRENTERVDVICGGFPCQDVSIAGKRAGLAGKRSGLWGEFARIISELTPGWVVIENVPGLLSSHDGRDFEAIISTLVEFGYGVAWRILDAQYFGVPQRRRRVFIVGSLGNGRAAEVLFERESSAGCVEESEREGEDYTGTIANCLTSREGQRMNETTETMIPIIWEPRSADGTPSIHKNIIPTLNTAQGGQRQPCVGVRRLTPTECCRLQGFPDPWNDNVSDAQRYKQMGNAVAVPVAEWIGNRIMRAAMSANIPDKAPQKEMPEANS